MSVLHCITVHGPEGQSACLYRGHDEGLATRVMDSLKAMDGRVPRFVPMTVLRCADGLVVQKLVAHRGRR